MNELQRLGKRTAAVFAALSLGVASTIMVALLPIAAKVSAFPTGGQVQSRAIYMSSSTPSATAQKYLVTFKPASTNSIKGVIVDFCTTSPIIGDTTCTAPTSFTVGTPTVTFSNTTTAGGDPLNSTGLPGTWTPASLNSGRTLKLTAAAGSGALVTSTVYSFAITTVTNPSTTGTFYARIITYTSDTGDIASYAPGTEGSTDAKDYGGFALSTTNTINITAKVQESLAFCVVNLDLGPTGNQCGDAVATNAGNVPNLTIGHGSPVATIDNTVVDRKAAYMQISTNATNGAVVRMHTANSCANAGLSSTGGAACSIPGQDVTPAAAMTAGTAAYGLYVGTGYTTTGVATSTGTINASANYHNASHTNEGTGDLWYGMDNTANSGVTGTYGSVIADTNSAPCNTMNAHLVFAATASLTTPAGIYTTSESLIATGTF